MAADQFFLSHVDCDNRVCGTWRSPSQLHALLTLLFQIGLDTLALFCKKKSYGTRINNKLYCSQITKQFVLKKFPLFPEKVLINSRFSHCISSSRRRFTRIELYSSALLCDTETIFRYFKWNKSVSSSFRCLYFPPAGHCCSSPQ